MQQYFIKNSNFLCKGSEEKKNPLLGILKYEVLKVWKKWCKSKQSRLGLFRPGEEKNKRGQQYRGLVNTGTGFLTTNHVVKVSTNPPRCLLCSSSTAPRGSVSSS